MLYNCFGVIFLKDIGESRLTGKQKKIFTFVMIILALIFSGIIALLVGKPMIQFVRTPEKFREFVESYGIISDLTFIIMIVFQMIIAIIPGEPFEIAAGYAFGAIRGTIDCMIGFLVGSALIFLFVRKFGVRIVEVFFSIDKIKDLKFLQDSKRLNTLTFIIFLIPGTPKDLISYFIGLTDMKLSVWLLITATARIPSLITSVLGGSALGSKRYEIAVLVFIITMIVSLVGLMIYRLIKNNNKS